MDEQVDQLGQIAFALHDLQIGHLCVDEFAGDRVKVDLDGALGVLVADVARLRRYIVTL